MQLNTTQLQTIEHWLSQQTLDYSNTWGRSNSKPLHYDVQCEMVDHIASDIEHQLKEGNNTFEETFQTAKEKWNTKELQKLEVSKNKSLRAKYNKSYLNGLKDFVFSAKIIAAFVIAFVLYRLLMIDEYWFSEVKFIVMMSCMLFGLGLILVNMYQTEKINGKQHRFLLNGLSYRIIAVQTGITGIVANTLQNFFIEPMNFFNADTYDFHTNSIRLSILLTLMLIHVGIVYFVVHKSLKKDLKQYVQFYT
jgi:hypothetical protein